MQGVVFTAHEVLQGLVDLHGDGHSIYGVMRTGSVASDAMDIHREAIGVTKQHAGPKADLSHWQGRVNMER
jgi:hypothetical protein